MAYLLILMITSLGLGRIALWQNQYRELPALRFFAGFSLIGLLMYVSNILVGISLGAAALVVFVLALFGLALFALDYRDQPLSWRVLTHPLWVWSVLISIGAFFFGIEYTPRHWDEFSHWILMPKQMFLFDNLLSQEFLYKQTASYTPGWPATVIYPLFILSEQFSHSHLYLAAQVSGLGLFSLIYDLVKTRFNHTRALAHEAGILSWVASLGVLVIAFVGHLAQPNVLIESPLVHMVTFFFLCNLAAAYGLVGPVAAVLLCALGMTSAYFYKTSVIALILPFVMMYFWLLSRSSRSIATGIQLTVSFAFGLVTFACFSGSWKVALSDYQEYWKLAGGIQETGFVQTLGLRSAILGQYFLALIEHFVLDFFPLWAFAYWAWWQTSKSRQKKFLLYPFFSFAVVYLLGLLWLYFFSFSYYEGMRLASFERYTFIISMPLRALLVAYFILSPQGIVFFSRLSQKLSKKLAGISLKKYLAAGAPILIVFGTVIIPLWERPHFEIAKQAEKAVQILRDEGQLGAETFFIAQEDNGFARVVARYYGLGEQKVLFHLVNERWAFATEEVDIWTEKTSKKGIVEKLESFSGSVIWVAKANYWLREALAGTALTRRCPLSTDAAIIIRVAEGYACYDLESQE